MLIHAYSSYVSLMYCNSPSVSQKMSFHHFFNGIFVETSLKQQGSMFQRHFAKRSSFVRYFCDGIGKNLGISIAQLQHSGQKEVFPNHWGIVCLFLGFLVQESDFAADVYKFSQKYFNLDFENANAYNKHELKTDGLLCGEPT